MLDPGLDDLFQRAAATKARLRADVSAQAIGLDWQRRTGCGINETYDPPQCVTSKPALIPRRSSIIFLVTTRGDGKRELLSSTLVSATVDFREASGAAVWSKCQCLQPPTANQKPARLLRAALWAREEQSLRLGRRRAMEAASQFLRKVADSTALTPPRCRVHLR